MDLKPLITLIEASDLSAYQADLLEYVRPAIAIDLELSQKPQLGQSRIGGVPDLPDSIPWLEDRKYGGYLCFLLQINLAELPVFPENPFPQQGMLYLFASEDNPPEHFILYTGNEPLTPASLPNDAEFVTDWYTNLVEHRLNFSLFADLPRWDTSDYNAICDRLELDDDSYNDLTRALDGKSIGKLLGHVAGIGHDPRECAYIVRELNPEWLYDDERTSQLDLTGAQQWQNLLQLDSARAVNLMFGDAGYLQLLVHAADLQRLDFSRIYINLESS